MFRARVVVLFQLILLCGVLSAACSKKSPSSPTPPTQPSVSVNALSATSERTTNGVVYRVVAQLRETAGVSAPVSAVELTFTNGTTTLVTSRFEQVLPSSNNAVPAGGTASTRELVTTDSVAGHPGATRVAARVLYGDSGAVATGGADVPALPDQPPPPTTYTLTGEIRDQDTSQPITGARVEAINGSNAGKNTTTNSSGVYSLTGLVAETFRMRASADGYNSGEQNVTVPDISRADMLLRKPTCTYTVAPTGFLDVGFTGGSFSLTITRTAGACGWQASTDASWITLGASSGSGDGTLTFTYQPNALFVGRTGTVTLLWSGGSATVTVRQAAESPAFCRVVTISVNGQNPLNIGSAASGPYTATITPEEGTPPGVCGAWTAAASTGVTITSATSGPSAPASVTFTVSQNPGTAIRPLTVTINFTAGNPSAVLQIYQSGS